MSTKEFLTKEASVLLTERLVLRPWKDADYAPFFAMSSDPAVSRYLPPFRDRRDCDAFIDGLRRDFAARGWGFWALECRESGLFAGMAGMHEPGPEFGVGRPCVEIGWRLAPAFQHRGLATEAGNRILRFAFEEVNLPEIVSFAALANTSSINVMRRLGLKREKDFDLLLLPCNHPYRRHSLYTMTREEWITRHRPNTGRRAMTENPLDKLHNDINGFMQASVLGTLAELDLASMLLRHGNALTAREIAQKGDCDARACTMLLDAITALGYFEKSGYGESARYSVADAYREHLDSSHPRSSIPFLRHLACQQRLWARLSWTVRSGEPQERVTSLLGADQDKASFIMGMNSIAVQLVDSVVDSLRTSGVLSFDRDDVRILDVGGASGTYTLAFLEALPESTAVIFDLPAGITQARKRDWGEKKERVTLVEGDFTRDPLPSGFDFAWVSAIIHQMNREECRALYSKVRDALSPGGTVAIRDFVMDRSHTSPLPGTLFGINMLVSVKTGRVYSFDEIREDLEQSGFTDIRHAVDVPTMCAVVSAKRK